MYHSKEEIVNTLQTLFMTKEDITQFYENIAAVFLAGSGHGDAEWLYMSLLKVTILWFSREIILPSQSKGEKLDSLYTRERIKNIDKYIEQVTSENKRFIVEWISWFTTLVWVITLDIGFTDAFEEITEIPYKDGEELFS